MNKTDLLKLLNVKPAPVRATADTNTDNLPPAEGGVSSPYALELNQWEQAQGQGLLETSPVAKSLNLQEEAWADFFAAGFKTDPELTEACTEERRREYIKTLLETPDYHSLHESTQLNHMASEMAAVEFGQGYAKLLKEDGERKARQQGQGKGDPEREKMRAEMALMRAAGAAVKRAQKEVEELEDMQNALGCGPGQGGENKLDAKKMAEIFQRVKNHHRLRRIIELAGRFRRVAQAKQRQKVQHGYDDVVGVEQDGDVGRLLPHEAVKLLDEELELDTMRRIVERQATCRKYEGREPLGKGPIVVCVDESGSMSGEPVCQAKAFALSMAWVARHQKRWVAFVGYSGGTSGTCLAMPPNRWDEGKLLEWLEHFFGGGTECDVPLVQLPNVFWPKFLQQGMPQGRTDLIVISDGLIQVPPEVELNFNAWKAKSKCKAIGLMIGHLADGGGLGRVLDEVHAVRGIDVREEGVERCLSV